ncbi:MAG: nucleotidyltransferase family protein [Gemmatimonadota bacterium]
MVLAAGRGSRLRPLTDTVPKPLVPVAGRPLLEYGLRLLARHGFDQVMVNLHHLPDHIPGHFGDGGDRGLRLSYSREPELLGTAGAVRRQAGFFDEPFLVYYADNLCNVDLGALWRDHLATGALVTIGALWMGDPTRSGILEVGSDGRVRRLLEKPGPEEVFAGYLVNGGIYAMDPAVLETIPGDLAPDFARHVFPALIAQDAPVFGHRLRGQLLSTDTPDLYAATCARVDRGDFALP